MLVAPFFRSESSKLARKTGLSLPNSGSMQKRLVSGDICDQPCKPPGRPAKRSLRVPDPILILDPLRNALALLGAKRTRVKQAIPTIPLVMAPDNDTLCLGCLRLQGAYDHRPRGPEGRGQGVGYSLLPGT